MDEHLKSNADPHYEETTWPKNPPDLMVNPHARTVWLASSLGVVVVIVLLVAGMLGWVLVQRNLGEGPLRPSDPPQALGTSGTLAQERSPGGFNPNPVFRTTEAELRFRGAGRTITRLGRVDRASAGARVNLSEVRVDSVDAEGFTIRDNNATARVVTPGGMPTVRTGQRVDVSGTIEAGGDTTWIRASRIDVR